VLADRLGLIGKLGPDEILERFLDWFAEQGFEPYSAQEEAWLELMTGRHVVLNTPTGSGKSLVATALHFKAMCEGRRSFYTAPIKALASEKFFALCKDFGPENVGMLTGDASINPDAPIVCCTAEVLANMALRSGESLQVPYVVMDEFHYYADPARGVAWQIPLLTMPRTVFLLMSATLGDTREIREDLARRSGREVALVDSEQRPVPLDFEYCETPLHETVEVLLERGKGPIYVVNFSQRECAELAQGLTSLRLCSREERKEIGRALGDFRFDTAYGRELRRFIQAGIGVHHAGLLPKYRLLVEQLSQRGLLKLISGTDTLGVGVNIPIRTVLFTRLTKFDGRKLGLLRVREFKQISGRAGRKGFDEQGSVVCQAPEHVIGNKRAQAKQSRGKRKVAAKRPRPGFVHWDRNTFQSMIERPPEELVSRFRVTHDAVVNVLRREEEAPDASRPYRALIELIDSSHESVQRKRRLRRDTAQLVRGLRRAGIVEVARDQGSARRRLRVSGELQWDFSLHHALSLYLVDASGFLNPDEQDYALDLLSLVEAILEDPRALLQAQLDRIKRDLLAELKAERVPFEERIRLLDEVEPPQPNAEFIHESFAIFAETHPWVHRDDVRPKSIAREMFEGYYSFEHYVRRYGLQRMEGLLLRYLGQVCKALQQGVSDAAKTDEVHDVLAFFRLMIERTDSSLVAEWESLVAPGEVGTDDGAPAAPRCPGSPGLRGSFGVRATRPRGPVGRGAL
jgi:superfamily II RNA helicase